MRRSIRIGTAGWAIPRNEAGHFPSTGSGLARYASTFIAAEINSTFRRDHKPDTLLRWADTVGDDFRFSVKMPKKISHEMKLQGADEELRRFTDLSNKLGPKLGPWLLQLPPSLSFDFGVADSFFKTLRTYFHNSVVCEPRHPSWFVGDVARLLETYRISRVAADPGKAPNAGLPGGAPKVAYYRLHGSPRIYYSAYDTNFLAELAASIQTLDAEEVWCIFDNTASGAAMANALSLRSFTPQLKL
jgi:uncharacterized protein YecE (DUF72 family)